MFVEYMEVGSNHVNWVPNLMRVAYDWEVPSFYNLLERLSGVNVHVNQDDQRIWLANPKGRFSVKSCCSLFELSRDL